MTPWIDVPRAFHQALLPMPTAPSGTGSRPGLLSRGLRRAPGRVCWTSPGCRSLTSASGSLAMVACSCMSGAVWPGRASYSGQYANWSRAIAGFIIKAANAARIITRMSARSVDDDLRLAAFSGADPGFTVAGAGGVGSRRSQRLTCRSDRAPCVFSEFDFNSLSPSIPIAVKLENFAAPAITRRERPAGRVLPAVPSGN